MEQNAIFQQQRANCYKLLSLCYYQPDKEITSIIQALKTELASFSTEGGELLDDIIAELEQHKEDHNYFLVDYARLFVGPFNVLASPYSSVYLDHERRVMGDSTMDAIKMYQKAGLEINGELKDVPDHIKVELEFMQYLILKNISLNDSSGEDDSAGDNRAEDNPAGDNINLELQRIFLFNHLALWLPDFCQTVTKNAQTVLYKNLAEVTQIFVSQDKDSFPIKKEG